MSLSVIDYSSSEEKPEFEQKIIDNIITQSNGLPIISVTRKPSNLGKNICVGEVPVCYMNSFKQLLIGLKEATTEFCIATESDVLYPPEYFTFIPPLKDKPYRYTNVWVHFAGRNGFWKKPFSEGGQMCGRLEWIRRLEAVVTPGWELNESPTPIIFPEKTEYSWTGQPLVTFKTRQAKNFKTGYSKEWVAELPPWGAAKEYL